MSEDAVPVNELGYTVVEALVPNFVVVEFEASAFSVAQQLVDSEELSFFEWLDGPGGARFRIEPPLETRSASGSEAIVRVILDFATATARDASVKLIAEWLAAAFRRLRPDSKGNVSVAGRIIPGTPDEFRKAIAERINQPSPGLDYPTADRPRP